MKFLNFKWSALAAILSIGMLASCSDKDNEPTDGGSENDGQDQEQPTPGTPSTGTDDDVTPAQVDKFTPEQSKEYLQNTATNFLNQFKPADQKSLIDLTAYFIDTYGDLEFPDDIDFETRSKGNNAPLAYMKALNRAAKGDVTAITRAASTFNYYVNFGKLTGIYEPNRSRGEWVRTGSSNNIVLKFSNQNGQPVEVTVSQSGGTSDYTYSFTDEWYDYWSDETYRDHYNYYLSIPKKIIAILKENGKELVNTEVNSNINVNGHSFTADITGKMMNIDIQSKINGTDSKVEANTQFSVNGKQLGSVYAVINGSNLCNKDKYESMAEIEDEDEFDREVRKMFKSGSCNVDVMGNVQVDGKFAIYQGMGNDLGCFDNYDYNSKTSAESACQSACNNLNKNLNVQMRYKKTNTVQGTFIFQPKYNDYGYYDYYRDSYYNNWEYYASPVLKFPDGTTYEVESYFEGFSNVVNKWEVLIEDYENIWDRAFRY